MPILKICSYAGCGRIVYNPPGHNRCPLHPKPPKRTGTYMRNAAKIRATATTCGICGKPFTDPDDPPVADHVIPRADGGSDDITNLRPAHRSCNGRRGANMRF
jgi:5-methylcytosine-specific restriction endonuclease McrA